MCSLPAVTGQQAVKAFSKLGFHVARTSGSHYIMKKDGHRYLLSVPVHTGQTIKAGTLRGLIAAAGTTPEEFAKIVS